MVLKRYPGVAFAYVYGSTAKGKTHKASDLDIALGFSRAVSDETFYKIFNELDDQLAIPAEKLDLKNFAELPLAVRFRVVRDGKLIYLKDYKTHREMVFKTIDFYHDELPVMQKFNQLFLKQTARL